MIHSEPQYAEITLELKARLDKFRDEHMGAPLGGVGSRVLFEDDNVRIWEMTLEPGEASDLHHHEHDYYLIIQSGDLVAGVTPEDGPMGAFVCIIPPAGNTLFVPKGRTEWAYNVGGEDVLRVHRRAQDHLIGRSTRESTCASAVPGGTSRRWPGCRLRRRVGGQDRSVRPTQRLQIPGIAGMTVHSPGGP